MRNPTRPPGDPSYAESSLLCTVHGHTGKVGPCPAAQADVQNFELWRWFFFFGGIAPIWWVGDFVVRLLVFLVESAFLNTRNVMYFLVAVRVSHVTALLSLPCRLITHIDDESVLSEADVPPTSA